MSIRNFLNIKSRPFLRLIDQSGRMIKLRKIKLSIIFVFLMLFCYMSMFFFGCSTIPSTPSTVVKPTDEYVWPPSPAKPRIKFIKQWSNRYDFGKPSQFFELLVGKERVERLFRPNGVIADKAGNVYVADTRMARIFVFDVEKNTLRFLGETNLSAPIGLAIDNKRNIIYVSDTRVDKVFGIDKNTGRVIISIGAPGEFMNPSGMVYDELRDRLYVADTQHHMVKVFDKDGNPLFTIGKRGNGDGEFNFPSYLALDRNGTLFVDDSFNFRVQMFDPEGKYLKKFGQLGDSSGYFTRPNGIGVDSDGHVYVVDAAFNNFQIFNQDGKLLLWVGTAGRNPGQFYLPTGMYIDEKDRIYVTDTFNYRVQVFQYLK